jgi:hypothetical protein
VYPGYNGGGRRNETGDSGFDELSEVTCSGHGVNPISDFDVFPRVGSTVEINAWYPCVRMTAEVKVLRNWKLVQTKRLWSSETIPIERYLCAGTRV